MDETLATKKTMMTMMMRSRKKEMMMMITMIMKTKSLVMMKMKMKQYPSHPFLLLLHHHLLLLLHCLFLLELFLVVPVRPTSLRAKLTDFQEDEDTERKSERESGKEAVMVMRMTK